MSRRGDFTHSIHVGLERPELRYLAIRTGADEGRNRPNSVIQGPHSERVFMPLPDP